jgi:hypothetical protein
MKRVFSLLCSYTVRVLKTDLEGSKTVLILKTSTAMILINIRVIPTTHVLFMIRAPQRLDSNHCLYNVDQKKTPNHSLISSLPELM